MAIPGPAKKIHEFIKKKKGVAVLEITDMVINKEAGIGIVACLKDSQISDSDSPSAKYGPVVELYIDRCVVEAKGIEEILNYLQEKSPLTTFAVRHSTSFKYDPDDDHRIEHDFPHRTATQLIAQVLENNPTLTSLDLGDYRLSPKKFGQLVLSLANHNFSIEYFKASLGTLTKLDEEARPILRDILVYALKRNALLRQVYKSIEPLALAKSIPSLPLELLGLIQEYGAPSYDAHALFDKVMAGTLPQRIALDLGGFIPREIEQLPEKLKEELDEKINSNPKDVSVTEKITAFPQFIDLKEKIDLIRTYQGQIETLEIILEKLLHPESLAKEEEVPAGP